MGRHVERWPAAPLARAPRQDRASIPGCRYAPICRSLLSFADVAEQQTRMVEGCVILCDRVGATPTFGTNINHQYHYGDHKAAAPRCNPGGALLALSSMRLKCPAPAAQRTSDAPGQVDREHSTRYSSWTG